MKGILEKRNYDTDFELWCRCYRNVRFLAHYHTDIEMLFVRSGCPQITVNNVTHACQAGDILLFKSGDIHFNEADTSPNELDFVVFNPTLLGELFSARTMTSRHLTVDEMERHGMADSGRALFDFIHSELRAQEKYYKAAIKARLCSFWVEYLRYFGQDPQSAEANTSNRLSRIRILLDYIDRHYSEEIPLTKAADLLGYDTFHCSKTFKAITGVNFVTYLNTVRVGKALEFLQHGDQNILDIALDCGFNNPRTFNRVFKEITQMTPSEYLKTINQQNAVTRDDSAQNHTVLSYSDSYL